MDERQQAFYDFEHAGWEEVADAYASAIGDATAQVAPALLDAVALRAGDRLLDVATGPGYVASAGSARGADAVGLDFAAAMVALASARHPTLTFERGAAESLPFDDATFDVVVSAFGMPHFADHYAHFREALRVLDAGGRFGYATWKRAAAGTYFGIFMSAIADVGRTDVELPEGPEMFTWGDAETSRAALTDLGFANVRSTDFEVSLAIERGVEGVLEKVSSGVRARALYEAHTEAERRRIEHRIGELLEPHLRNGATVLPAPAIIVSADKP